MIANHSQFIDAINEKKKVRLRYFSQADSGVLDRVCAPLDYGPGAGFGDGLNRYWFWDSSGATGAHAMGLMPPEIMELHVLGELLDPAELGARPWAWAIPRDWGTWS